MPTITANSAEFGIMHVAPPIDMPTPFSAQKALPSKDTFQQTTPAEIDPAIDPATGTVLVDHDVVNRSPSPYEQQTPWTHPRGAWIIYKFNWMYNCILDIVLDTFD